MALVTHYSTGLTNSELVIGVGTAGATQPVGLVGAVVESSVVAAAID